ncbi:MAG: cytochrome c biogenesis protein CcsA [Flavobacteriales bacterium]|nr:cytochrome c biogenesis protein CcsA [Flavobacteriales bacterium]
MIEYVGEHIWAGRLGHLFTILSVVGAALSTIGYFLGASRRDIHWERLGRLGFRVHSVAVLGIVVTLFTMLFKHWFEYDYVWKHSNLEMPLRYIASCFWEGQEGSFLLWTFWHAVLGNIFIWRAGRVNGPFREWEAPVMTVVALVQVFLACMLLGIYIGDLRLGSSPFLLIRELPENLGLPWTRMPGYLNAIPQFADGRGLNPLLQNYWMVIHPPTLFLGFAATLIPFAFVIASLWRGDRRGWIAPALPWAFFGVMVLGTGILMGGAWAYEALSFGGFWAWDPVENASLVPWLTLVGAAHLMIVNKRKETSIFSLYLLTLLTFILILYSTFLTRSGVLGDTSVHSFTGDGMLPALVRFLLIFIGISVAMLIADKGQRRFYAIISACLMVVGVALNVDVPAILLFIAISIGMLISTYRRDYSGQSEEESLRSREFWLFIGSLVLLLSAVQITFSTSVPVFNLLLEPFDTFFGWIGERTGSAFFKDLADTDLAPPAEAVAHYNKWQVPFAFIVSLLVAMTQYLRWKDSDMGKFRRQIGLSFLIAVLLTALGVYLLRFKFVELDLIALFFATTFAAVANAMYIGKVLNGNLRNAGASIAHVGFALVLLGALISTGRRTEVSRNSKGMDLRFLSEGFSNSTDILLYKGDTVRMGDHYVSFRNKRKEGVNVYFDMDYFAVEPQRYGMGDTVHVGDMLFTAKDAHTASATFLADQPAHWQALERFPRRALWYAREWTATRPGAPTFRLQPFIQVNPRFGNVAEPSTKHWLHRDLYTHVRYADQTIGPDSIDDAWMPDRTYNKQVGDTIITPTSMVIIDSVYTVQDSATKRMLGERYTVHAAKLRVRDLYRPDRWFDARPLLIYAGTEPVAGKSAEVPPLRIRYGLASVDGEKIDLNIAESEFLVLQALAFPGINILWVGCVLLFLGTFLAVVQRIRGGKPRDRNAIGP